MEYAGTEEALGLDLDRDTVPPLRIRATKNAMLVVLRELRNVQIHLVRTEFLSAKRFAISRLGGEEREHELTVLTIPRNDLESLRDARNATYCNLSDFEHAVDWGSIPTCCQHTER